MRVTKTFSLRQETVHELTLRNIKNVSKLVDDLLKVYLQINNVEDNIEEKEIEKELIEKKASLMIVEQKKAIIDKKKEDAEEKLRKEIENGEVLIVE